MDLFHKDCVSDDNDDRLPIPESATPPPPTLQQKPKRKQVTETATPVRKSRRLADPPGPRQCFEDLEVDLEVDLEFDLPDVLPDGLLDVLPEVVPEVLPAAAIVSPTPTSTSTSPLPRECQCRRSTHIGDVKKTTEHLFNSAKVTPKAVPPAKPKKQLTVAAVGLRKTVGCGPALIDQSTLPLSQCKCPLCGRIGHVTRSSKCCACNPSHQECVGDEMASETMIPKATAAAGTAAAKPAPVKVKAKSTKAAKGRSTLKKKKVNLW